MSTRNQTAWQFTH